MTFLIALIVMFGFLLTLAGIGLAFVQPKARMIAIGLAGTGFLMIVGCIGLFVVVVSSMN